MASMRQTSPPETGSSHHARWIAIAVGVAAVAAVVVLLAIFGGGGGGSTPGY
jgi:hypothetical protein